MLRQHQECSIQEISNGLSLLKCQRPLEERYLRLDCERWECTYFTFAENVEQHDGHDGHQRNNYVHAKYVHIRETRIAEEFLDQMHHRYGRESE